MTKENKIVCSQCGAEINISDIIEKVKEQFEEEKQKLIEINNNLKIFLQERKNLIPKQEKENIKLQAENIKLRMILEAIKEMMKKDYLELMKQKEKNNL